MSSYKNNLNLSINKLKNNSLWKTFKKQSG